MHSAQEMLLAVLLSLSCLLVGSVTSVSHDPNFLPGREVMVHLFDWRWQDIAEECERFLGPMGYAGVQTSPANENGIENTFFARPWWERYQPMSYNLTTRSGNEVEFADMVARCNAVGVRVYVDVILNHMLNKADISNGTGGNVGYPSQRLFPAVPYLPEHSNSGCTLNGVVNPTPEEYRKCDVGFLVDMNQGHEHVRDKMSQYLNTLVGYGVAGFRFDKAMHMWPDDLEIILSRVQDLNSTFGFSDGARPFLYQEVFDLGESPVPSSDYFRLGTVTEFKFANEMGMTFTGRKPLSTLANIEEAWGLMPSESAFVFLDNNDMQHGHCTECSPDMLTHKDPRLYRIGTAFQLAYGYGFPRIMSSFYFTDPETSPPMDADQNILPVLINADGTCGNGWVCEHRWPQIANMVAFRATVEGTSVSDFWSDGADQLSFCRGDRGFLAINNGLTNMSQNLQTCLSAGVYCDVISGQLEGGVCTGKSVTVQADGTADIEINSQDLDGVIALHANAKLL